MHWQQAQRQDPAEAENRDRQSPYEEHKHFFLDSCGAVKEMKSYYDGLNAKLLKAIPPARKILELGCANGRLGQRYKGLHPEASWTGVDCCDEALNVARGLLDQTLRLDLDTDDLDALGNGFDVVVIGDLLEHLKRPGLLLAQLKRLVTSDARLVL